MFVRQFKRSGTFLLALAGLLAAGTLSAREVECTDGVCETQEILCTLTDGVLTCDFN